MNIMTQLKTMKDLTNNEKIIVDFILREPNEFIQLSSDKICRRCYVSAPTLYRLCAKIGVNGLSELKLKISSSLTTYKEEDESFDYDYPIDKNQTHYEIINVLKEDYEKTIASTMNLFDLDQLRLVVNALKKAKQIDIYTSAGNIYFAQNFKFQMQEIGVLINVPEEEYLQTLTASTSDENHFAIIISFGGRGTIVEKNAKILKRNQTPILLISSADENPLAKYATYQLYFCSYENHSNKISSFSTRMSLLYILDTLYSCYFKTDYERNKDKKLRYYENLTRYSKKPSR